MEAPLNGLVQQPGWLSHKSRRFGGFLQEIHQICCFSAEVVQYLKLLNNSNTVLRGLRRTKGIRADGRVAGQPVEQVRLFQNPGGADQRSDETTSWKSGQVRFSM
jgi:hypothetical protein